MVHKIVRGVRSDMNVFGKPFLLDVDDLDVPILKSNNGKGRKTCRASEVSYNQ